MPVCRAFFEVKARLWADNHPSLARLLILACLAPQSDHRQSLLLKIYEAMILRGLSNLIARVSLECCSRCNLKHCCQLERFYLIN